MDKTRVGKLYEVKTWDRVRETYVSLGLYWVVNEEIKEALEDRIKGHAEEETPELFEVGEMTVEEAKRYSDEHLKVLFIYWSVEAVKTGGEVYWPKVVEEVKG